jgi:hypothetical protein
MTLPNLDYRSPNIDARQDRGLRILIRLIWLCALLPMTLGLLDLILYALFDAEWLVVAGLFLLPIGTLVVLTGIGLLIAWFVRCGAYARARGLPPPVGLPIALILLLLANIGVAILCFFLGVWLVTLPRLSIAVHNATGAPLEVVRVRAGLRPETRTDVARGDRAWFNYRRSRVRSVEIHVEQAGKVLDLTPVPRPGADTLSFTIEPGLKVSDPATLGHR